MGGPTGGARWSEGGARPTRSVAVLAVPASASSRRFRRIEEGPSDAPGSVRPRAGRLKPAANLSDGELTMSDGTITTMSQRPDPRRSPTPYAITARLTTAQYVAL